MDNHLASPENSDADKILDKKHNTSDNTADDNGSMDDERRPMHNGVPGSEGEDDDNDEEKKMRANHFFKSKSQPVNFAPGTKPDSDEDTDPDVIPVTYYHGHERPKSESDLPVPSPPPPPPPPPPLAPPPPSHKPSSQPACTLQRRRTLRLSREQKEAVKRHAKKASKQFLMFLVSHVGLTCVVVAYSIIGGFIFQRLEASNEKDSRTHIQEIRERHVKELWNVTQELNIFDPDKWLQVAEGVLKDFQSEMYEAVKDKAWDGTDNVTTADLQWTYAGALLYSVTVITTIGYGNLTPKTVLGRVVTMLYAVIGIPMTLLCLANIGSFMARCFRILWKQIVCKPCRNHIRRRSMYRAAKQRAAAAAYVASLAKQKRGVASQGGGVTTGSGRGYDEGAASDSPAAVHDGTSLLGKAGGANNSCQSGDGGRYLLGCEGLAAGESVSSELHDKKGPPSDASDRSLVMPRAQSISHSPVPQASARPDPAPQPQTAASEERGKTLASEDKGEGKDQAEWQKDKAVGKESAEWQQDKEQAVDAEFAAITITSTGDGEEGEEEGEARTLRHTVSMSSQSEVVRVPIMVCLIMVAAYIVLGAVLFSLWEDWTYFESSYFCFITLSTIGFGDIVPGYEHNAWGNQAKRVSCTLYLLFGLALLAMCFELIQSECRQKFLTLAAAMGLNIDGRQK